LLRPLKEAVGANAAVEPTRREASASFMLVFRHEEEVEIFEMRACFPLAGRNLEIGTSYQS
jgi:hypothetical protein